MSLGSRRYAAALLEIAKENNILDEIYLELEMVVQELIKEKKMWQLMTSAQVEKEEKEKILQEIFEKKIHDYLYNFLRVLLKKNRFIELELIFLAFKESYLNEKNILEASVLSAIKLTDEHIQKLQEQLEKRTRKKVIVKNKIEESILGGLVIYIGEQVIDGSVRNKLNVLRSNLQNVGLEGTEVIK